MQERIEKSNNHLPDVKCMVSSCYYHTQGNYCSAEKIEIQPPEACDSQETDCVTFIKL